MPTDSVALVNTLQTVPHLDQYFGLWAMQERMFLAAVEHVRRMDIAVHIEQVKAAGGDGEGAAEPDAEDRIRGPYYKQRPAGGVAVIDLVGPMTKYYSSFSGGTATIALRNTIRRAVADDAVHAILLRIDSPGGTAAGTPDLGEQIARATEHLPVHAFIEDLGASAAYWAASQATKIWANQSAWVGSIGTYGVIYDMSGMAAMDGVKVHVVKAGDYKGMGEPGTEVTPAQLDEIQRLVDQTNEFFVRGVAAGRKMTLTRARELADGRVHIGTDAQKVGLIDGIRTFDQVLAQLQRRDARPQSPGIAMPGLAADANDLIDSFRSRSGAWRAITGISDFSLLNGSSASDVSETDTHGTTFQTIRTDIMAENTPDTPNAAAAPGLKTGTLETLSTAAATFEELKAACAKADAAFIVEQLEKKATVAEAQTAWQETLLARVEASDKALGEAKAAKAPAAAAAINMAPRKAGGTPLSDTGGTGGDVDDADPIVAFDAAVRVKISNGVERLKAIEQVAIKDPELHQAYLLAINEGNPKATRQLKEKYTIA